MKKNLLYIICAIMGLAIVACSSDESDYPAPTNIPEGNIQAVAGPGIVTLNWETPSDADFYYMKVTYTLPETGKVCTRLASLNSNGLVIDNLLKRYGPIEFTLQTFNRDESKGGDIIKITAQSEAAELQYVQNGESEQLVVEGNDLFADTDDGSNFVANLVDGDTSTFYQGNWGSPTPLPHYIVVNLPKSVYALNFSCSTRIHSNNDHPKTIKVYGSDAEFTSNDPFDPANATLLSTITTSFESTTTSDIQNFTSGTIRGTAPFNTLWLEVTETVSGSNFYALSELSVTELKTDVYDPETGETTPVE